MPILEYLRQPLEKLRSFRCVEVSHYAISNQTVRQQGFAIIPDLYKQALRCGIELCGFVELSTVIEFFCLTHHRSCSNEDLSILRCCRVVKSGEIEGVMIAGAVAFQFSSV